MFCYRDMCFCTAKCNNMDCSRNTKHIHKGGKDYNNYQRWSETLGELGEDGGPVAFSDFSKDCEVYIPEDDKDVTTRAE